MYRSQEAWLIARFLRTFPTKLAALSISSSVVKRPKLNRIEASLWSAVRPSARSTWDGSGIPEEQAAPVEAASFGCKEAMMSRASNPSNRMFAFPGCRRSLVGPLMIMGNPVSRKCVINISRWRAIRFRSSHPSLTMISDAAAIPTQRGNGTVPERRPSCWPPPYNRGSTRSWTSW